MPQKFITTAPISESGKDCELKVWNAAKSAFSEKDCIGYWRYPLFAKVGEVGKEPDILIADRESRGWACLSGIGNYPLYDEIRKVIASGDTFSFTFQRPPKINTGEEEET